MIETTLLSFITRLNLSPAAMNFSIRPFVIVSLGFAFHLLSFGSQPTPRPLYLHVFQEGNAVRYVRKAADLPLSVTRALGVNSLKGLGGLANPGMPWNSSDVIVDATLPGRRLIWAAEVAGHYVVHYEMGGFVYATRLTVLSPESQSGQRQIEASVCTDGKLPDFPAFQRLLATDSELSTGAAVKTNPVQ